MTALGVTSNDEICASTFCSDDLPESPVGVSDTMSRELFQRVDKVWTSLLDVDGESTPMSDDLYEHIVAL